MIPQPESLEEIANRLVPMRLVLEWTGIYVPEFSSGKSVKTRCPFADMFHLTKSAARSMRVYVDTNSGNCFSGCGVLRPVSIHARLNGFSYAVAASELLSRVGYAPKSFSEKWQDAVSYSLPVDLESYRESLLEYCRGNISQWQSRQYEENISGGLSRLLAVLSAASSADDADRWLHTAKAFMLARSTS